MNSTLTLNTKTSALNTKTSGLNTQIGRTLLRKWDMLAILGLLAASAAYSVCAVTQMTGF